MKKLKRKRVQAILLSAALKTAAVMAMLYIYIVAAGIVEGVLPITLAVAAMIGAGAMAKECMDAVIDLEAIIKSYDRHIARRRILLRRIEKAIEKIKAEQAKRAACISIEQARVEEPIPRQIEA